jgi:DNA-binding NtrC family response regulator
MDWTLPLLHVVGHGARSERGRNMAEAFAFHAGGFVASPSASLKRLVEDYERRLIEQALERANGNQRRAAADLGCLPTTLNEKMRRLGMRACDRTPPEDADTTAG